MIPRPAATRAYADAFDRSYSLTRQQIANQAAAACNSARPATEPAARWLGRLAERARWLGRYRDERTGTPIPPPAAADLYRTPVRVVARQLGRRWPRLDEFARAGRADGTVAARLLTSQELLNLGRYALDMPSGGAIDRQPTGLWLEWAARQWRNVAADDPAPLPGTTAATIYHALAGRDWYDQPEVAR